MPTAPVNDGFDLWAAWWKGGSPSWQRRGVSRHLLANKDVILAGKTSAQVFIPLCGKEHELKWFRDLGHHVVGVEFVEECVREYFRENDLEMEESVCPVISCKILQTPDKTIRVFICDIFDFKRYVTLMKSLLADDFSYGLCTLYYDAPWYIYSPRSVEETTTRKLYGEAGTFTLLDSKTNKRPRFLEGRALATTFLWHITPARNVN